MKKIIILGSTGSIGTQTLDIVARHPDRFQVVGLAAGKNISLLREQIARFRPQVVSIADEEEAKSLRDIFSKEEVRILAGEEGPCEIAQDLEADLVVSAIVGAAGLKPTMKALEAGKTVALANKESLVIAGELMTRKAREKN